jgi:hypothetical protein
MNKLSKIIIGIMSVVIIGLISVIIVLLNKLNTNGGNTSDTPKIDNKQVQNAIGIYYSQEKIIYTNATLKLNKDMTCEYSEIDANCKWSISDDEITLTYTWYRVYDDTKYNDEYYTNNNSMYTSISKKRCEDNLKNAINNEGLINARCENYATQDEKVILINGGVLYKNFKFNKIK